MRETETGARRRRKYRRDRRRRRRNRRRLFLVFAAFLVATALVAVFWGRKPVDPVPGMISATEQHTPSPPPQWGPEPSPLRKPITADSWKLVLVNQWNPLPEGHSIETVTLTNGLKIDKRCYDDLQAMMDACRAEGLTPIICSAYRSRAVQERLYQAEVKRWLSKGYTQEDAEAEAGTVVAVPGTSEHQLGLAVDIVDIDNQLLDESQEDTEVQKWLMEHSWEYGFILRYPTGKSDLTGIIYEPWHYRYVGKEDAEQIHALDVCLEEYLADE